MHRQRGQSSPGHGTHHVLVAAAVSYVLFNDQISG